MMLSIVGGAAGLALALVGVRALVALAPADIPRLDAIRLDATVMAFALAVTAIAGALFGVVPALQAAGADLHLRLRAGSRSANARAGGGSARARRALVVSEVALAIVLLAGAGLLIRSFARLRDVNPGFRTEDTSTFTVTLSPTKYPREDQQLAFSRSLLERVRQLPGVQTAATTFGLPLSTTAFRLTFEIAGRAPASPTDEPRAQFRIASPDYFRTLGIPLLRGRSFDARDRQGSAPVVLISQETARRYWPNEDPIGQRILTGFGRSGAKMGGEIIGVVGDVRQFGLDDTPTAHAYLASDQWPLDEITVVMRSTTPAAATLAAARTVVRELDPELPLYDVAPLADMVADSLAQRRFYLMLLAGFAGVALLLAAVGIYGVIAYSVQQRSREIGIRVALGASRESVLSMILGDGLVLVLAGVVIGTLGAVGLTRLLRTLLFGVSATDPVTFVAVPLLLVATGVIACALPARRAVRLDPMLTIRGED
jgi:putative ABC transport system permease protein